MLDLFEWVSLRDRRINFGLIGGRVVIVFGGRTPPGAHVVDRLDAVVDETEGVSDNGRSLNVGALGIERIMDHLASIPRYRGSGRALHNRLSMLFAGSCYFPEMLAASVRAICHLPDVGGDTGYFLTHAKRQLGGWTDGNVDVAVVR